MEEELEENAQTETETSEETVTEETEDKSSEEEKPSGVQKRINELTYKMRQQEREAKYWKEKAEKVQKPEKKQEGTPDKYEYDNEEDYIAAMIDYRSDQREAAQKEERAKEQKEKQQLEFNTQLDQFNQKGFSEFEDYESVVLNNQDLVITDEMAQTALELDNGQAVAYHLGKNPELSKSIAEKTSYGQAVELSKLNEKLKLESKKKTTSAPPPVEPVSGLSEPSGKSEDDMSMDEWMMHRYKQINNRS